MLLMSDAGATVLETSCVPIDRCHSEYPFRSGSVAQGSPAAHCYCPLSGRTDTQPWKLQLIVTQNSSASGYL